MMSPSDDQHRIQNEPHLARQNFEIDPTEAQAERKLADEQGRATEADAVEHTVWSEPALSPTLTGPPGEDQLTYRQWFAKHLAATTWAKSWGVTLAVALAAGPWGVLGAVAGAGGSSISLLLYTVFGPVTEEVAKVAAALWVIEKRPFLFKSMGQILLCAACGGLAFSAIENLIYLFVYVPDHSPEFVRFRWTVCVFLHMSCSCVAGIGLVRIWDNAIRNVHPPRLALGVPWFVIAMVGHGLYNLSVIVASAAGWLDLGLPEPPAE